MTQMYGDELLPEPLQRFHVGLGPLPFLEDCLGSLGLERSVVVVATCDQTPLMRVRAAHRNRPMPPAPYSSTRWRSQISLRRPEIVQTCRECAPGGGQFGLR